MVKIVLDILKLKKENSVLIENYLDSIIQVMSLESITINLESVCNSIVFFSYERYIVLFHIKMR